MDRQGLADFLLRRRQALQPADIDVPAGSRRRTPGLRREEVAAATGMSVDYYTRLEQARGPQPSEQMVAALARGLRLSLDERDHLFRLAGHNAPSRVRRADHVSPALLRVLDRLHDTPARVITDLGETLAENRLAAALLGSHETQRGLERSAYYRWFTDPRARDLYPPADHERQSRLQAAYLRAAVTRGGADAHADELVASLLARSTEFAALWARHEVAAPADSHKTLVHPELGAIEVDCQVLHTENRAQALLVFTATPGTVDAEKLELLSVIGTQFAR